MTKTIKLILLLLFISTLGIAYFVIFHQKASAPLVSIKKEQPEESIEPIETQSLQNNTESEIITPTEKNVEEKKTTAINEEIKKETNLPITDYQLLVTKKLVSFGFTSASNRKIDTIVIHSSYNALGGDEYDVEKLIAEYKEYGVSPHYLVNRQGKIYQLVNDKNIAYHAGESKTPDGRSGVNNFSLGIEMINTQEDKYTSEQYTALNSLLSNLKSHYSIKYVLGHKDISPGRKTDPWNFDWKKIK